MQPLVSILIPAFNAESWLAETIRSALAQTWPRKEIIIVDDGSKDNTFAISQKFASDTVFTVSQGNQGAAASRNKAFSLSRGDYIQWLDADDLLAPDKLAIQMRVVSSCSSKLTLFSSEWGSFLYRPGKAKFSASPLWCDLAPVEWLLLSLEGHWMPPANWLMSRELALSAGPWNPRLSLDDDGEYISRVVRASNGIRFVPSAKTYYRKTPNSLSHMSQSDKKWESQFLSMQLQFEQLRSLEDTNRTRAACLACLQRYLIYFYPQRLDLVKKARESAATLGGQLEMPKLSWKYAWIQKFFGWSAAKRSQIFYNCTKSSVLRALDKVMYRLTERKSTPNACIH